MLRSEREHLQGGTASPGGGGTKGRGWSYRAWKFRQGLCEVGTQTLQKRPCADGAGKKKGSGPSGLSLRSESSDLGGSSVPWNCY